MAFNTLEYLEAGNVDFVYNLSSYDFNSLIKYVRASERKDNIIKGFLKKLMDTKPRFCFEIIYDNDDYYEDAKYLLNKHYSLESLTKEQLESMISNCRLGKEYFYENFEQIINKYQKDLTFVFNILFSDVSANMEQLKLLAYHSNLHIRFLFMKYLILNHKDSINLFYDDISKYLTSQTYQENEQLALFYDNMPMKDACELAFLCFDNGLDYSIWLRIKNFILENYQYNELAYRLLDLKREYISESSFRFIINQDGLDEFNKEADTLFRTSSNYRFNILNKYSKQVSADLLEAYRRQLVFFTKDDKVDDVYKKLEFYGLGRTVEEYVDKYLSLSSNHTHEFIESGSTASCYRIGDYTFKLIRTKWSYEPIICPNLYLILPNIEEVLIRNDEGIVLSGIEVQKYLKRSAKGVPLRIFTSFTNELERLGYYTSDTLINGTCGDNCRMLDNYHESGNPNPPLWFKMFPVVLVDRDRIYQNDNKRPKQLRSGY